MASPTRLLGEKLAMRSHAIALPLEMRDFRVRWQKGSAIIINPGEGYLNVPAGIQPARSLAPINYEGFGSGYGATITHLYSYADKQDTEERERAREKIFALKSHEELLEFMAANDLGDYVDDYYDYLKARQSELEEGESPGIIYQSLQSWVWFLIDYALPELIPVVKIRADYAGCVNLVWRLSEEFMPGDPDNEYFGSGRGIIAITFYPSPLNYVSVMSGGFGCEKCRITFRGEYSHAMTKEVMNSFKERLLSPNA